MSQYIAEEQNLLANFNKTISLRGYYQVTLKLPLSLNPILKKKNLINCFFKIQKVFKNNFFKN